MPYNYIPNTNYNFLKKRQLAKTNKASNGLAPEALEAIAANSGIDVASVPTAAITYDINGNTIVDAATSAVPAAAATKGPGFFKKFLNKATDPNTPVFSGKFDMSNLKNARSNILSKPLWEGGPTVKTGANVANAAIQGVQALSGLYNNAQADADAKDLKSSIESEMISNPMYDMYLSAEDEKLLRQIQNGSEPSGWSGVDEGVVNGIPNALLGAVLGGLTGGPMGAIIGGGGALLNSGIEGYNQETSKNTTELQGLYDRLRQASSEYKTMKRPRNLRNAGLSSRYYNELY